MRSVKFILLVEDYKGIRKMFESFDDEEALSKRDFYRKESEPYLDEDGLPNFWVEVDWSEGVVH